MSSCVTLTLTAAREMVFVAFTLLCARRLALASLTLARVIRLSRRNGSIDATSLNIKVSAPCKLRERSGAVVFAIMFGGRGGG